MILLRYYEYKRWRKKVGKIEMPHGWKSGEEESGKWEGGSAKETESENVKKTVGEKPLKESL